MIGDLLSDWGIGGIGAIRIGALGDSSTHRTQHPAIATTVFTRCSGPHPAPCTLHLALGIAPGTRHPDSPPSTSRAERRSSIPGFRDIVVRVRALGRRVMDRCNLTIVTLPNYADLPEFLAAHQVEVVASPAADWFSIS